MRLVEQHLRLAAALFVLILCTRTIGSSPFTFPPQTRTDRQRSGQIDSEVAQWSAQLKSTDEEKRREAVMQLSHLDGEGAASAIASALTDSSPRVRAAAVAGLARRSEEGSVSLIAERLTKDKDEFVRKIAAHSLASFRGRARTDALIAALQDKKPEVRGAAAVALADHPDALAVAALAGPLADKDAFVRAHAARALGVNGSAAAQAVPALIKLLTSDEDNEVKRQAATALGRIGDRSALDALRRARHDKDPYLAQAALDAIRAIESKK
jgi:HEAT repeat protein